MTSSQRQIKTGAMTVVVVYALSAGLWILLSDRAIGLLFRDPESLVNASMAKGWFFVAVTSLLLYGLMRRLASALLESQRRELGFVRERQQPPPMLVAIADASPDAIFAKDDEGRYVLFNNAAARIVGKPSVEVVGVDDRAIFPAEEAAHIMALDRRVRDTRVTEVGEEVLHTVDGERVFLAIKGPLCASDGSIFGTYGISRDITERKRAEIQLRESKQHLRLLVDHTPAALAMFDREMRYLEVSQRWRDDYALGDAAIIGRSHYELFPEVSESWKLIHQRGLAGESISEDEDCFERSDGRLHWLRWEVRPWRNDDGTIGGIVIFSEDISQRINANLELRKRNQELEHFNRAATERELRMVALKRQVNELAEAAGRPAPYDLAFADAPDT